MKEYFLDHNAHTKMHQCAIDAIIEYNSSIAAYGHPSSPSLPGREASIKAEESRIKIASLLGAKNSSNIIFTSTCTQAAEWGMKILNKYDIAISPVEHAAVKLTGSYKTIPINKNGVIHEYNNPSTNVSCIHVQNELGIIQPIENINCNLLMSDMCQSVGKVTINLAEMNVDVAIFGAHKFGGSAGVGILYIENTDLWKEFGTGSRYYMDRTGTPDVAALVASAAALEYELMTMPERSDNCRKFQNNLEKELINNGLEVLAKEEKRVYNTTFVCLPKPRAAELVLSLSQEKIYIGLGSACGATYTGPSTVMQALGRDSEINSFIRISQHGEYDEKDASYISEKIITHLKLY